MEHISFDRILSYLANQIEKKEIAEIEGHIAICDRCHKIFVGLKSIESSLRQSFTQGEATSFCPEDWEIGALIKKELPLEISNKISSHMKDCDFCIDRAAVYYKAVEMEKAPVETPELWKGKALNAISAKETIKESRSPFLQRIFGFFHEFTSPLPAAVGLATVLLVIAVLAWITIPDRSKSVTVASNEKIVIRDSEVPSAFGFTGAGETKEVKNMEIFLNGKEIIFKWKPIEGAKEYEFALKDKKKVIYKENIKKEPVVSLSTDIIEDDRTYSWLITGKTSDNRYFEYTGDFLLVK
jgi:hypothetical protein